MELGFLSVIPVILAITLAIKTKNVILSLFISIFLGVMLLHNFNLFNATSYMIKDMFVVQLADSYNAGVIVLMLFIGGFIELMMYSGGAHAFAKSVEKHINSKKKVQFSAYLAGIMIFFSDLGTPLIVGPVFQPFFKKLKVSREKLAFILDSTASPVAVLVPFIGWGVFIIGIIQKEFSSLRLNLSDYESFIKSIPFNIYSILAVTIIPIILSMNFEFKQMKQCEDLAALEDDDITNTEVSQIDAKYVSENAKPSFVWAPILLLLLTLFGMLGIDFLLGKVSGSLFRAALTSGYLYASALLMALMLIYKTKTFSEMFKIYMNGMCKMTEVGIILILAWTIGSLNKELGTADYLVGIIKTIDMHGGMLPIITFVLGCVLSFAMGSSWGTFSILFPIILPIAIAIDAPLYVTIGSVLAGGLFGDHVSPISSTTILSSAGAQCDHISHVKTQMSYAIFNACIAGIFFIIWGFIPNPMFIFLAFAVQIIGILILKNIARVRSA